MHKKRHQHFVGWKGKEDYGASLLRGLVLFALKTAAPGLRHSTFAISTASTMYMTC